MDKEHDMNPLNCVQVAFPLVGGPPIHPKLFEEPEEYSQFLDHFSRSSFRHVLIEKNHSSGHQTNLPRVKSAFLDDLNNCLKSAGYIANSIAVTVRDREFSSRPETPLIGSQRKRLSFAQDPKWEGDSHQLAIAVGILALTYGFDLPNWILFSSDLKKNSVATGATGNLSDKVGIALGYDSGNENLIDIHREMYNLEDAVNDLGPKKRRMVPGQIKAFVVAHDAALMETLTKQFECGEKTVDLERCCRLSATEVRN